MKKISAAILMAGVLLGAPGLALGNDPIPGPLAREVVSQEGLWTMLDGLPADVLAGPAWIRPTKAQHVSLDFNAMMRYLESAPLEGPQGGVGQVEGAAGENAPLIFTLPMPNGLFERFLVVESPIMEPGLAAQLPGTKTFLGQGIDTPAAVVRFDHTPAGFHAMILSPHGTVFIDPVTRDNVTHYASYYVRDYTTNQPPTCFGALEPAQGRDFFVGSSSTTPVRAGPTRREYALACAANGEYTAFHGGTVTGGQNAVVTAINRVNTVYENEFAIRLILVANNSSLIFTNASTDPYNNSDPIQMLNANTGVINGIIGSGAYDIGHVVSTAGGGVAVLQSVCSGNKGAATSGLFSPVGDPFIIQILCHEIGHQFGANHSFNGTQGNCGPNRSTSGAIEPGSGSTIMAYGGICGADNIVGGADPYFHAKSFDEVIAFISSGGGSGCDTEVATGNTAPTVTPPASRNIPRRTPFTITGSATDAQNDSLTYCWEEFEQGAAQALSAADNGSSPNFRSFAPSIGGASRTVPRIQSVTSGTLLLGEKWYDVARSPASWRLTVRDNRAGGGGVNTANVNLTVVSTVGPFTVTAPLAGASWAPDSTQTVTWDVAGTNVAPIGVLGVSILLSTDGGVTYPIVLANATPNDGSETITVPNLLTSSARIRVEAIGNYFFNVNPGNFSITGVAPPAPTNVAAAPNNICNGSSTTLTASVQAGDTLNWYTGSCGGTLVGTGSPLVVSPSSTTTYFARARRGLIDSTTCGSVTVTVSSPAVAPTGATVNRQDFCSADTGTIQLSVQGGSGTTARWFTGSCGGTSIATGPTITIASPSATNTYFVRWESGCGVTDCASVTVNVRQPPIINPQPQSQTVNVGDNVTFTVGTIGSPPVTFQWRRNDVDIPGANASTYTINNVQLTDAANYRAVLSNNCGTFTSVQAVLTVNDAPNCPADFNDDGQVDFFDYLDFASAYSNEEPSADFNADGQVDFFDYLDFAAAFDTPC
ncbi:MAG: M12 family metallo-peptidase [Planctomycetota bacterium]|nr:M12 family metallo-peptidase [Planctomycetota bacterium]